MQARELQHQVSSRTTIFAASSHSLYPKSCLRSLALHPQVHKVTVRCRSLAQSILAIFPDLRDSIVDRDVSLSQHIFDRLRTWIGEVKVEAQRMQTTYAALIMEVQMSVETARALLPLSLHAHHVHSHSPATSTPASGASTSHAVAPPPAAPPSLASSGSIDAPMDAPAESDRSTTPASPLLHSTSPDVGGSPLMLGHAVSSTSPHAIGDELMELLFDTPSVVGDDKRLQRILTKLGVSSEAGHVVATRTTPASAVIAAMQQHAGAGSVDTSVTGALLPSAPGIAVAPSGLGRDSVPPHVAVPPALPEQQVARAFGPVSVAPLAISPKALPSVPTGGLGRDGPVVPDELPKGGGASSIVPLSVIGDGGKCLGCALADLRRVDLILTSSVGFWTSMELVIDVAVRRKEHSETLLLHASSRRALAKATSSLQDYMAFWQAFHFLCGRFAEAIQLADLYAWLTAPEAEEHVHHRLPVVSPGQLQIGLAESAGRMQGSGSHAHAQLPMQQQQQHVPQGQPALRWAQQGFPGDAFLGQPLPLASLAPPPGWEVRK